MPKPCIDLVKILLESNPAKRMGLTKQNLDGDWYDYDHLFKHEFFKDVDFDKLQKDNTFKYL